MIAAVFPCRASPSSEAPACTSMWRRMGVGRRRHVCAGHATAAAGARAHRGQPPAFSGDRRIAGVPAQPSASSTATDRLQRVPRGFSPDHEAADYLKYRQFLAGRDFPAAFATSPRFYAGILGVFRQVAPLVRFLNEPC